MHGRTEEGIWICPHVGDIFPAFPITVIPANHLRGVADIFLLACWLVGFRVCSIMGRSVVLHGPAGNR